MVKDNEEDTELQQEEYHYSDPDSSPDEIYVEEPEQQVPNGIRGMVDDKRKRIILILVIVGLIFVVLQFAKAKNKTDKVAEPVPVSNIEKVTPKNSSAQPIVAPAVMSTTEQSAPNIPTAAAVPESSIAGVPADSSKLNDDQLSKTIEPVQAQQLQTSVSNLETNVTHLTEVVNSLQAQVQDLVKKHEHMSATSSVQKKTKHSYIEKRKNRESGYKMGMRTKSKVYYVKAVVPRRAWLQTENGEALTVKVDDRVPGYGVIKSIDASEGVVTTSSNKIIRFNTNDN